MKTITLAIALAVLGATANADTGPDLSAGTDIAYFTKLRFDTAQKEGYQSIWRVDPERKKIQDAFRARDIDAVLTLADAWLKRLPIDADVHLMVAMCFKEKGNLPAMTRHLNIFYGLLGSITASGDGLSPQTAFKVVSIDEEYSLIQEIGGKVKTQTLLGSVDEMDVERSNGKITKLYFDASVHFKTMDRQFNRQKK